MTAIYWPPELPFTFLMDGLAATRNSNVIRTTMDAGPKKTRRRYTTSTKTFSGRMILDSEQRHILERFYQAELADGVLRFMFADPQTLESAEFRFTEDYTENTIDGMFEIIMQLERL